MNFVVPSVLKLVIGTPEGKEIYAFDLDDTIIHANRLIEGRAAALEKIVKSGGQIVIFSNQLESIGLHVVSKKFELLRGLNIPLTAFAARSRDEYRKPGIKMLELIPSKPVVYVGDAAGRPGDFSDSDLKFAEAAGIKFATPDTFFHIPDKIDRAAPDLKNCDLILLVGPPASGKSSIAATLGGTIISRDVHGTRAERVFHETKGLRIVDNMNASRADRAKFMSNYKNAAALIMTTPLDVCRERNASRAKKVPEIVYRVWKKKYEPPTVGEGFTVIHHVQVPPKV